MFENPLAVVFFVVVIGMAAIGQYNDFCSFGDLFTGRAFSWNHHVEHINREFKGFFYVLAIAVFAGFIALIGSCLASNDYQPKKVFIKDLVGPQAAASGTIKHKTHAQNSAAKAHTPSPSHATKKHIASAKVPSNTFSTTKQSHAANAKVASH